MRNMGNLYSLFLSLSLSLYLSLYLSSILIMEIMACAGSGENRCSGLSGDLEKEQGQERSAFFLFSRRSDFRLALALG